MGVLFKKAFSLFKRELLLSASNLITGIFLARALGPTALGIWGILVLVPSFAESLGRIKVDQAAVYFIGKKRYPQEAIYFQINLIAILSSVLIIILILLNFDWIYNWLFKNSIGNYKKHLLVLLLQIPMQFLLMNHAYFHIANENIVSFNRMLIIQAWTNSILSAFLLIFTSLGFWSIVVALLAGSSSALVYGFLSIDRSGWVPNCGNFKLTIALLRYGFHFYIGGVLGQFQQSGTQLLSVAALLPAQMSFLNQGQALSKLLCKVSDSLNTVLYPRVTRCSTASAVSACCLAFRLTCIALFFGCLVMGLLTEPLILLLYGKAFKPTSHVIYCLLPSLALGGSTSILLSFFIGTGRAAFIPVLQLFPVAIQLILAWQMTPELGLMGATLSISIGICVYSLSIVALFLKTAKVSVEHLLPKGTDFIYLKNILNSYLNQILQRYQSKGKIV